MLYRLYKGEVPWATFEDRHAACYYAAKAYEREVPLCPDFDDIYDEFNRELSLGDWKIVEEEN